MSASKTGPQPRRRNASGRWLRGGMLLAVAVVLLSPIPGLPLFISEAEDTWLNWRYRVRGPVPPPPEIVVVGVDESTFRVQAMPETDFLEPEVRTWMPPRWEHWDRRIFGRVLDKLIDAGVAAVGFDFVFLGENPGDAAFAEALGRHPDQAVLGYRYLYQTDEHGQHSVTVEEPADSVFPETSPEPRLGLVNVFPDSDGMLRRTRLGLNSRLESLIVRDELERFTGDPGAVPATDLLLPLALFEAAGRDLPEVSPLDPAWIHYYGGPNTFAFIPLEGLFISGRWDGPLLRSGEFFRDKIVLIGPLSEIRFKDTQPTPTGVLFGVEVHATILANLLEDRFLRPLPVNWQQGITFGAAVAALAIFILPVGILARILFVGISIIAYWFVSQSYFERQALVLPFAAPLLVFGGIALIGITHDAVRARVDRLRIRRLFGTYLAPEVVRELVDTGVEPELGGEDLEITAFFSDLEGFSSFSEQLSSPELVEVMNRYLSAMTEILLEEHGTLDKYVGDAIVAFFNAPLRLPKHAACACRCAIRMQDRLAELREAFGVSGRWPPILGQMRMRIGINTGLATVGNMGSATRFNYTMNGDSVNLAARCESGAKQAGVYTLVTEDTFIAASRDDPKLVFRYLDLWQVKGRVAPVAIYELVGFQDQLDRTTLDCLKEFSVAIEYYKIGDWTAAAKAFAAAECLEPNHRLGLAANPSAILRERCEQFQKNPPPEDWDGVHRLTAK